MTLALQVYSADFVKKVLVEEFSTEKCQFCPEASMHLQQLIDDEPDKFVALVHHAGFETDWLTNAADIEYEWFYNSGDMYAPAFMVDRTAVDGEDSVVFGNYEEGQFMRDQAFAAYEIPAECGINVRCETDEYALTVSAYIDVERRDDSVLDSSRLTVCLVEDNIEPRRQAGAYDGYLHEHVARAYNEIWGVPIEWDGKSFHYEFVFSYEANYNVDNMKVLAFVNDYDPYDKFNCHVHNAEQVTANGGDSTIEVIKDYGSGRYGSEIFTLSGLRVDRDNLSPGIYFLLDGVNVRKVIIR